MQLLRGCGRIEGMEFSLQTLIKVVATMLAHNVNYISILKVHPTLIAALAVAEAREYAWLFERRRYILRRAQFSKGNMA
jgi:hypothetical protein